ncbi:gamma-glutamyltransferase [Caulobacter mirabilis]|uniref:Glutathione hydrolase proenzyme n=1 Tax=Caulobacter mirabilis TaxID=69666 RepID=A0A2D2AUR1_9CAUL|nr:gamma-glutamyltransferase [Caulobacter mirabilis]ATQ41705.1 gamma-glutamyltransferase [Caulobacter mirabilis]
MRLTGLFLALFLAGCAQVPSAPSAPRQATAEAAHPIMVAAANPHAVDAGLRVLKEGGTAADAAVAVQAVLSLVEPQSSGVGGGAFMVYYDAASRKVTAYDGRETAPSGASPDMFLGQDGKPLPFREAVLSGRATGVPGAVAMLALAQKEHGRRPWSTLFSDAERLADDGFAVSPRLAAYIQSPRVVQNGVPDAARYFSRPDGTKLVAGDRLVNKAYAETVRILARDGAQALYEGPLAEAIADRVRQAPLPGSLTTKDIAAYRPLKHDALCRPFRVYQVCVPPPPSSGVALLQGLMLLERTDIADRAATDPVAWVKLAEAERLLYADRDRYVGDPKFVDVPVKGLLDPAYVAGRAKLIGDRVGPEPEAGTPPGAPARRKDRTLEPAGTSHFTIVDRWGNAVSMTTTVENVFGTGRMVGGFFLNNQLTDFSFSPNDPDGAPAANAVAPGKRPRSSMAPVIVLDREGRLVAALGSPGGNAILSYNLKAMVGIFDWEMPVQAAFDLPNLVAKGGWFSSEPDRYPPGVVEGLKGLGLTFNSTAGENSGLHGFVVRPGGVLEGAADSRREGQARSE